MIEWLDNMVKAHSLPDRSKAIRCCINCVAMENMEFMEIQRKNFHQVEEIKVELAKQQIEWIERNSGSDKSITIAVAGVIQACQSREEQDVFGIVRCKKKINECKDAQVAVKRIEQKYGHAKVEEEIQILR